MTEQPTEQPPSRRDFLGLMWRLLGVIALGEGGYLGLRFLASRKSEGSVGGIVTAGLITDFQPGTVTPFDNDRFFLIVYDDGGFLALHSKCTHLACIIGWEKDRNQFVCPCHGSVFNKDGSVANPPAPRPLDRFPISFSSDSRVLVDTSQPIQRITTSADELVYAPTTPVSTSAVSK